MSASDDLPGRGIYQPLNPPEPVPAPPLPEELEEQNRRAGQYDQVHHGVGYSGEYADDYDDVRHLEAAGLPVTEHRGERHVRA